MSPYMIFGQENVRSAEKIFRSKAENHDPDVCLRSKATSYIRLELTEYFPENHIRRLAFLLVLFFLQ
ncbi:MAG: hypothetical protein A2W94_06030 [Bacteroidetes bacterium GWE2_42_42]|nr:MAG: hypothetical protein A2W94_06030 [Bacteroidetes bacterium GWE2_42_42]HCB61215.1 hypothetical protein [Bacteroidales bacterium]